MFLQQRDYQLLWVGKRGLMWDWGGSAADDILQKETPLLQDAAHCIKWKTFLQWGIIFSLNPNICKFYLLIFEGWTSSYVCREAAGYSFALFFLPSIFPGWLWTVFCCWVPVDSVMVSESLSIKITATRKEQLSYRAALSSSLLIASGQMSAL